MWHEIAFSEGKRRRSFFQVAVSGWEKQRNGHIIFQELDLQQKTNTGPLQFSHPPFAKSIIKSCPVHCQNFFKYIQFSPSPLTPSRSKSLRRLAYCTYQSKFFPGIQQQHPTLFFLLSLSPYQPAHIDVITIIDNAVIHSLPSTA